MLLFFSKLLLKRPSLNLASLGGVGSMSQLSSYSSFPVTTLKPEDAEKSHGHVVTATYTAGRKGWALPGDVLL
jgi:hypothetical protein